MKIKLSIEMVTEICNNSAVRSFSDLGISLTNEFLNTVYGAWLSSPSEECIHQFLVAASLDLDKLGLGASKYLHRMFRYKGRPSQDMLLLLQDKQPRVRMVGTKESGYIDALLHTGKFVRRTKGIGLEEHFEEELFQAYPGQSVEEGLRKAGINPKLLGCDRLLRIKHLFDERLGVAEEATGEENRESEECVDEQGHEVIEPHLEHPYVLSLSAGKVVLRTSFYNDAASLSELPIERILSTFELDPKLFSEKELRSLKRKLSSWEPLETDPVKITDTTVKILRNRMKALQEIQDMRWQTLGELIPSMSLEDKKELFTRISLYFKELGVSGELGRVLKLLGVPRSSFYGCLSNKQYGEAKRLKEQQDEEDAAKIRYVFEYKNFKKGSRLIQMMLPAMTGVSFSLKKVRRLMKKFGMECGVRGPNEHKRASKKFMETHVKPDLLRRRFRLGRPNKYRLTDVTYLDFGKRGKDGKQKRAYGSAMIDSVTGKLIVLNVSMSNDEDLVLETLRLSKEYPWIEGGMIHSDQGILYLSDDFQKEVLAMGLDQSMSKRGNSQDNAPCESFFGHFKDEADYAACDTFEELEALLGKYKEYYNTERPMADRLGKTPVEFEEYLTAMDDEEFSYYLAGEEKKYLEKKAKAKELAIARAKTLGIDGATEDQNHGEDSGNDK